MPGQFGPIKRALYSCTTSMARVMSITGIPSVMHTMSLIPALAASIMASAAPAGGTKIQLAVAPVVFTASSTVSKTGVVLSSKMLMLLSLSYGGYDLLGGFTHVFAPVKSGMLF